MSWRVLALEMRPTLERLYLIAALILLYSTVQGIAIEAAGLRQHVDPHWNRGLSYLKISLQWCEASYTTTEIGSPKFMVKVLQPIQKF
ncbi:hypothetical protein CAL7716_066090 [Calothrix sp. PCC 7716]|nr:hypothetical protein CAL7716_066090 [Calothrix sp. PCC 7716]